MIRQNFQNISKIRLFDSVYQGNQGRISKSLITKVSNSKSREKKIYRSDKFGRDLSSVKILLTKQETCDIGLKAFETEGIQNITELKDKLISSNHIQG